MDEPLTRVLVVDKHPVIRRGLVAILHAHADIDVVGEAAIGDEALLRLRTHQPDVAILDVVLPQVSGFDVMRQAREYGLATRFLVITDSAADECLHAALAAGAQGYMLSNAEPAAVVSAVRALASGGVVLEAHMARRLLRHGQKQNTIDVLSARELDVLGELIDGASNKVIAARLAVSEHTVRSHVHQIMQKLQAQSRTEAAAIARTRGLVDALLSAA